MPSITPDVAAIEIAGGVDTHQDTHTAAVIDPVGRVLGTQQFPATTAGYTALLAWMRGFGRLGRVGVEGTGAYGAGLTRLLRDEHVDVIEVDRPDRKTRRFQGKSDPIDAIQAAKAALAGERTGTPKQRDGRVEALRNLRVARRSAVDQRADAQRQIKALIDRLPGRAAYPRDRGTARLFALSPGQVGRYRANFRFTFTQCACNPSWFYEDWVVHVGDGPVEPGGFVHREPDHDVDSRVHLYGRPVRPTGGGPHR